MSAHANEFHSLMLAASVLAMVANDAPEVIEAVSQGNRRMIPLRRRLLIAPSAFALQRSINFPRRRSPAGRRKAIDVCRGLGADLTHAG